MTTQNEERLIDEIRSYIFATDQTNNERLAELARLYAESCSLANTRLTKCDDFLKQGLRTQAIGLAEEPPDLIRLVDVLNFAELDEWQELVGNYELARFEFLKTEIAAAIAAAYDQQKNVEGLLRKHRQLNLAGASLASRVAMLRQLSEAEPETQYWVDDLRTFEEHFATQLVGEAARAEKNGKTLVVAECVSRLEREPWRDGQIPTNARKRYVPIASRVHERTTFPELAAAINAAVKAKDSHALKGTMTRWDQVAGRMRGFDPSWRLDHQWLEFEKNGRSWLKHFDEEAKQRAFKADVRALIQAMGQNLPESEVAYYYEKAVAHGYPLPDEVQAKVGDFKYHVNEIRVLNSGILLAALVGLIVLIVLAFFAVWSMLSK